MGPIGCYKMGQGMHTGAGENGKSDLGYMGIGALYDRSKKKGHMELGDFRWKLTGGKCMWWNQMFRSLLAPGGPGEGGVTKLKMKILTVH